MGIRTSMEIEKRQVFKKETVHPQSKLKQAEDPTTCDDGDDHGGPLALSAAGRKTHENAQSSSFQHTRLRAYQLTSSPGA